MNDPIPMPARTAIAFFDRSSLASHLEVSIRTIDRLDAAGKLPSAIRIGGAKRWPRDVIEDWIRLGCPHRREDVEHDR